VARYLGGATVASLADGPIRDAMQALGELWHHDDTGVFVEHRATDACLQAIAQLRGMLPEISPRAPCALGGSPAGDPYLIPAQLSAMVAGECGMRTVNLGPDVPVEALQQAATELKPQLVWLSISTPIAPVGARALARALAALPRATEVIVGGREAAALTLPPRVARGSSMADLAELVKTVVAPARRAASSRARRG
jgi:methanogenic corrinoid protein MtbC1